MFKWIMEWWHKRQRRIDIDILWPICKNYASSIDKAREVFLFHTDLDPAWDDISLDERISIINKLM